MIEKNKIDNLLGRSKSDGDLVNQNVYSVTVSIPCNTTEEAKDLRTSSEIRRVEDAIEARADFMDAVKGGAACLSMLIFVNSESIPIKILGLGAVCLSLVDTYMSVKDTKDMHNAGNLKTKSVLPLR